MEGTSFEAAFQAGGNREPVTWSSRRAAPVAGVPLRREALLRPNPQGRCFGDVMHPTCLGIVASRSAEQDGTSPRRGFDGSHGMNGGFNGLANTEW